jgi:hypothetical protein
MLMVRYGIQQPEYMLTFGFVEAIEQCRICGIFLSHQFQFRIIHHQIALIRDSKFSAYL